MTLELRIGVRENGVFYVFGQTAMFFYIVHRLAFEMPAITKAVAQSNIAIRSDLLMEEAGIQTSFHGVWDFSKLVSTEGDWFLPQHYFRVGNATAYCSPALAGSLLSKLTVVETTHEVCLTRSDGELRISLM
jgi:hypothetical protein